MIPISNLTGVESVKDQEADDYPTGHYFTPVFSGEGIRDFELHIPLPPEMSLR